MADNVSLWVVDGDDFLNTQSPCIWIIICMSFQVSLYVVPGDEALLTPSTFT